MAMIVEVVHGRSGEVRQRVRVEAFPFAIGRALDNALVLDDPHVDARHARLVQEEDGALVVEDLGSVNKLATATHPLAERIRVRPGAEITVGRTTLRFRDDSEAVPPAIPLHRSAADAAGPQRWHQRTTVRLALSAAALALIALHGWLDNYERAGATQALLLALGVAVLSLGWAGVWAAVARAVIGQFRFVAHLFITLVIAVAAMAYTSLSGWAEFLLPSLGILGGIEVAANLALLAVAIAWHLANASSLSARRRWRAGATTSAVVLALIGLFALADDEPFTDVPEFSAVIKAAPVAIVPKASVAEFGAELAALKAEVDALRSEAVR